MCLPEAFTKKGIILLQEVMTLYFSHPAVEGIILWGFWDGRIWKPEMPLYEGPDVTVSILKILSLIIDTVN